MFVDQLAKRHALTEEAYNLFKRVGVGSYDEMFALVAQFPSIANGIGIDIRQLSNIAAVAVSAKTRTAILSTAQNHPNFAKGAFNPPRSSIGNGYQQPPAPPPSSNTLLAQQQPIIHPLTTPVRNQGLRGTCVAHAVAAAVEAHFSHVDLSEQFLYWAAKKHGGDPFPDEEGTWIRCAKNALASLGICDETYWPYNGTPIPNNETHEVLGTSPSAAASSNALGRTHNATLYEDTSRAVSGKANLLATVLRNKPVAVALPVFRDVLTGVDNWSWSGALDYGRVLDPPQFAVVDGGHAVCVCEFHPSASAPGGGWFVFKNSWGTQTWNNGQTLPPVGDPHCLPGYGYVSAAYIDEYLWELIEV